MNKKDRLKLSKQHSLQRRQDFLAKHPNISPVDVMVTRCDDDYGIAVSITGDPVMDRELQEIFKD
jgi:hypothetical protein